MTSKTKAAAASAVPETTAPVTGMLTSIQNLEVPAAARDFAKQTAGKAKERAAEIYAGSADVTAAFEQAFAGSLSEATKINRTVQQAIHEDVQAFFAGIEKLAAATSLTEAFQIQSDIARAQSELFVARAKASWEYLGKLAAESTKTAQDNFSKLGLYGKVA